MLRYLMKLSGAIVAAGLCFAATSCTSSAHSAQPASSPFASASSGPTLPAFPTSIPQSQVLVEDHSGTGAHTYTTSALADQHVTLQLACIGNKEGVVAAQLYQGSSKPIYQIRRQPCDGNIQKITLTAGSLGPLTVHVQTDPNATYALLMTQGT